MKERNEECCPEFKVEKWDKKTLTWENKLFIKETITTLFHIPFPPSIGKKVTKMHKLAQKTGATIPDLTDALILFHDTSAFRSEIYYAVSKEVDGANNTTVSGSFVARVFDGPFNKVPVFIKEIGKFLEERGQKARDYYVHYAYCPKCAKKYNHNYMIIFALV
ncbi:MAG TPA: hypothetical protein PLX08_03705 [Bacteroidales bacterium]|jgi:hypothetical protein|nr:hypothetical protein [Bacteroidales bacterium]